MSSDDLNSDKPLPSGDLALQVIAMPKDTNAFGDIFSGWLVKQMDLAASTTAARAAQGRVVTVAMDGMSFMVPVKIGSVVSCYTDVVVRGASSIQIQIEVWMQRDYNSQELTKVTDGLFVFVSIDDEGRTRPFNT
ncbi:MAG: acyl-CoA thioesterase [Pseudomonadota bacterium]